MYNTFISVVGIIADDKSLLKSFLEKTYQLLRENFQDFEVILQPVHNIKQSQIPLWYAVVVEGVVCRLCDP